MAASLFDGIPFFVGLSPARSDALGRQCQRRRFAENELVVDFDDDERFGQWHQCVDELQPDAADGDGDDLQGPAGGESEWGLQWITDDHTDFVHGVHHCVSLGVEEVAVCVADHRKYQSVFTTT